MRYNEGGMEKARISIFVMEVARSLLVGSEDKNGWEGLQAGWSSTYTCVKAMPGVGIADGVLKGVKEDTLKGGRMKGK